jgi:glutamate-1-semialdehyde-2,1-aminomutase
MFEEAKQLAPGGVQGIRRPYNFIEGEYPIFITHGKGGHIFDVDGNDYIDMLCSYGPLILGHVEPEIDEAVRSQMKKGFCFSLVQPIQNDLERRLTKLVPCAEMAILVKTGSDATTCAVRIARAYTGRTEILRCGYHGWHDWCCEVQGGILPEVFQHTHEFHYNDISGLESLLETYKGQVAGIIMTPIGHPINEPIETPNPNYLQKVRELATKHGAILIFDEVRTCFRMSLGGAQKIYNVTPDLAAVGKAIANGYPIAAVVGKREYMSVMETKAFISSTFFANSLEMSAAMATLNILEGEQVPQKLTQRGENFLKRLREIASDSGVPCKASGVSSLIFLTFDRDDKLIYRDRRIRFYTEAIRRHLFIQPYHHWYICYRHSDEDLNRALTVIEQSLKEVKNAFP